MNCLHTTTSLPPTAEMGRTKKEGGTHCVYVVRLEPVVMETKKFAEANPTSDPSKPCFYVGMTGLTPEKRFENHKANHWASRWVRDFGIQLVPELYTHLNRMPRDVVERIEVKLANHLRSQGHAVWQN